LKSRFNETGVSTSWSIYTSVEWEVSGRILVAGLVLSYSLIFFKLITIIMEGKYLEEKRGSKVVYVGISM